MGVTIDITGRKYGELTVLNRQGKIGKDIAWLCKCSCGNETIVRAGNLKNGTTKSCGCLRRVPKKHGKSNDRLYRIYTNMKTRCYNPKSNRYHCYGGKGIKVCDSWMNDFTEFYKWAINNGYKSNLTIDRVDVNGDYEPSNCRWATNKEQGNNTSVNRLITFNGETHTLSEWGEITKLGRMCIQLRIDRRNWSIEKALTTPKCKNQYV